MILWRICYLLAASSALSLAAVTRSNTWRFTVAQGKKVSGFLSLDANSLVLQADLGIRSGEADLFVSTVIKGTSYSWKSSSPGNDTVRVDRTDAILAADGFGLHRKFQIGALGIAPGKTSACLTISVTSDGPAKAKFVSTEGVEQSLEEFIGDFTIESEEDFDWGIPLLVVCLLIGACAWLRRKPKRDPQSLQIKLIAV